MQGVAASSTVLKDLPKGKLTNTVQHIQVYKSQGNQMSKNSRKPWKPIYIFLMTLRSFTLLRSCYVSVSIYSQVNFIRPKSSHLGHGSPLMSNTALRDRPPRRRPTAPAPAPGSGASAHPRASPAHASALLPLATVTSTFAFVNPAMFRTLQQTVSDSEMTQRSRKSPRVL